jgi:hypothetical protein
LGEQKFFDSKKTHIKDMYPIAKNIIIPTRLTIGQARLLREFDREK